MAELTVRPAGSSPRLAGLFAEIVRENPLHAQFLGHAGGVLTRDEVHRLGGLVDYLVGRGHDLAYLADCYNTVVADTFAEQMYFLRNGEYRCKTYAEVADRVYHDRAYMDKYMYGLVLTAFLWPNHVRIARFFEQHLPREEQGAYLEIGPGHGWFMATAAAQGRFASLTGIDISAASVEQTRQMVGHFAPAAAARCELRQADFLEAADLAPGSFAAVVMGEVLEHVEQPARFLRRLHELSAADGFVYVTTCINAPAIDHIYLWRSTDELEDLIRSCGFTIVEALRLPYEGKTLEQAHRQRLSINVAYVLARQG